MTNATGIERKLVSTAGPRQTKAVETAYRALERKAASRVELRGVIGGEETRSVFTRYPITGYADGFSEAVNAIGEKYGWTVTAKNYKAIVADFEAATAALVLPVEDNRISAEEAAKIKSSSAARDAEYRERAAKIEVNHAALFAKKPIWAEAIILAELVKDQSDAMSDYFNSTSERLVAIGWRKGKKEDFRQLRAAAATFEPTAHLGPDCDVHYLTVDGRYVTEDGSRVTFTNIEDALTYVAEKKIEGVELGKESIEHRENWSMGGGNYLKASYRHNSGWKVKSYGIGGRSLPHREIEDHLPEL